MRLLTITTLTISLLTVTACSSFKSHSPYNTDLAYKNAQETAPLQLPPGFENKSQNNFSIATTAQALPSSALPLTPPGANLNKDNKVVGTTAAQPTAAPQSVASTAAQPAAVDAPLPIISNTITVPFSFNEAWTRVGNVLPSINFPVMQKDKSLGTYYVADKASSNGKFSSNTPIYQIHLIQNAADTTITVLDDKNKAASLEVAKRILAPINAELTKK